MKNKLMGAAAAAALSVSFGASAANAAVVDLGFIIDESGSVGQSNYESSVQSLRNAIAQIPLSTASVTYRVGVVSFGASGDVVATPVVFDSAANKQAVLNALDTEAASGYGNPGGITFATNYIAAFNTLNDAFANAFGSLGDTSIINMGTDGRHNSGGTTQDVKDRAAELRNDDGWDVLSFEAIANTSSGDRTFLGEIGFDPSGIGGCDQIGDASGITDVANDCFVLEVSSFAEYEDAIRKKIRRTLDDTGGGVIPLPAGLPLLLTGFGALGALRLRNKRKAS